MRPDRWEKSAARENARRTAKAPLFARVGLVPLTSAQEREARHQRAQARQAVQHAACDERLQAQADTLRADVAALVAPGELRAMDTYRWRTYPHSVEYSADYWREVRRRLSAGEPTQQAAALRLCTLAAALRKPSAPGR